MNYFFSLEAPLLLHTHPVFAAKLFLTFFLGEFAGESCNGLVHVQPVQVDVVVRAIPVAAEQIRTYEHNAAVNNDPINSWTKIGKG